MGATHGVGGGTWARSAAPGRAQGLYRRCKEALAGCRARATALARRVSVEEEGQGTTEYAILVGVLVVIAIVAITAFRGKVQTLWDAISTAINGL